MKFKWLYLAELIIGLGLLFYMGVRFPINQNPLSTSAVYTYDTEWTLKCGDELLQPEELPKQINNPDGTTICLNRTLPQKATLDGSSIAFFTSHMQVKAYVDDMLIYSLTKPENSPSKTTGSAWNIVDLKNQYQGKELSIELTPAYQNVSDRIPEFMWGTKADLLRVIISSAGFSLFLCIIMLFIGLGIVIALLFLRKKLHFTRYVIWLGFFSVMLSLWSGCETQIFILLFGRNLFFNYLTFISLKLIFIPIMVFVRYLYNTSGNKLVDILCILSVSDFLITTALQVFGIADYRETLFITHIIYCAGAVWVMFLTVRILLTGTAEARRKVLFHALCIIFVAVTVLLDAALYYQNPTIDSAKCSRLGLLIYIIVLAYMVLRDSITLIGVGRQATMIREDARRDGLTETYNRKAYEEALASLTAEEMKKYSVAMFDLNNLKNVNDLYGHSMGDLYIRTVSRILLKVFEKCGKIYRIGGDEFCMLSKDMSEELFLQLNRQIEEHMRQANEQYLDQRMSVACGYAYFDVTRDQSLRDVISRADQIMYQNKHRMKKSGGIS
ncbi:MAG: GGDEF domain-containing protein [bacterium]|nr:GGDEF domain-containing protein [bacterium]